MADFVVQKTFPLFPSVTAVKPWNVFQTSTGSDKGDNLALS